MTIPTTRRGACGNGPIVPRCKLLPLTIKEPM